MRPRSRDGLARMALRVESGALAVAAAALLASALVGLPVAPVLAEPPAFVVAGTPSRISVTAEQASLQDVLRRIGEVAGVEIALDRALESMVAERGPVTISLDGMPPGEAVHRLLPESSLVLLYAADGALAEIRARASAGGPRALPPRRDFAGPDAAPSGPADSPAIIEEDDPALRARLSRDALSAASAERRAAALDELTGSSDRDLVRRTALEIVARDRDPLVLETALEVLSGFNEVPLDDLLAFAVAGPTADLRLQALYILGEHGRRDGRVAALLKTMASSDGDESLRDTALALLGDLAPETPPPGRP